MHRLLEEQGQKETKAKGVNLFYPKGHFNVLPTRRALAHELWLPRRECAYLCMCLLVHLWVHLLALERVIETYMHVFVPRKALGNTSLSPDWADFHVLTCQESGLVCFGSKGGDFSLCFGAEEGTPLHILALNKVLMGFVL